MGEAAIALVAAFFGFALTVIWEMYRHHRDNWERERGIVIACISELDGLEWALGTNLALAREELELLPHQRELTPFTPIQTSALGYLLLAQPSSMQSIEIAAVAALRDAAIRADEACKARDTWKMQGVGSPEYLKALEVRDRMAVAFCERVTSNLPTIAASLRGANDRLAYRLRAERFYEAAWWPRVR